MTLKFCINFFILFGKYLLFTFLFNFSDTHNHHKTNRNRYISLVLTSTHYYKTPSLPMSLPMVSIILPLGEWDLSHNLHDRHYMAVSSHLHSATERQNHGRGFDTRDRLRWGLRNTDLSVPECLFSKEPPRLPPLTIWLL